jgi:hypothetical protein
MLRLMAAGFAILVGLLASEWINFALGKAAEVFNVAP